MFVSVAGSVNVMIKNAFALPVTCQEPAVAAVGCTVVETPLITVPKSRLRGVVIVMPTVTTTASAVTAPVGVCALARPINPAPLRSRRSPTRRQQVTGLPAALNRERQAP